MPDDILDAAQKVINDASSSVSGSAAPAQPAAPSVNPASASPAPTEPSPLPPEPLPPVATAPQPVSPPVAPVAPVAEVKKESPEPTPVPVVAQTSQPTPTQTPLDSGKQAMVNDLMGSVVVPPAGAAPAQGPNTPMPPSGKKKKSLKGIVAAVLALLFLTIPVGVYYVSQQDQEVADVRSRAAWDTVYQGCTVTPDSCGPGYKCHCQNGNACTYTLCEPVAQTYQPCVNQGRAWCVNGYNNNAYTCCLPGYQCGDNGVGCYRPGGNPQPTDRPPSQPPSTSTPTSIAPICQNLKIYKNGTQITPSEVRLGDALVFAVRGNLTPAKAHFRVNGAQIPGDSDSDPSWTESTTRNSAGEFTVNYTVPSSGVTDFVVEAEVFTNGAWH